MFREPLVEARPGGVHGGGARLTVAGGDVVRRYRAIEAKVATESHTDIAALEKMIGAPKRKASA